MTAATQFYAFREAFQSQAKALALAIDDPVAITRKLAEWAAEHCPDRVATAWWITSHGDRDKGMSFALMRRPLPFLGSTVEARVEALLGAWSAGAAVSVDVLKQEIRPGQVLRASIGLGAVTELDEGGNRWDVVATIGVRF